MLAKLKAIVDTAKEIVVYILMPFAFVAGIIYYLFTKNEELKTEVAEGKAEEKLDALKQTQITVDSTATDSVAAFEQLSKQYEAANVPAGDPGSAKSDPGPKGPGTGT